MHRRTFLAAAGASALAGCLGGSGGGAGATTTTTRATTTTTVSLPDHPALPGLDGQPTRGPAPNAATGLVVAFEDPSCPSCRRFEARTYPELTAKLVDPGVVSFVFRGIPVVYRWAVPAVRALEAAYAHEAAAFWALKRFYYRNQGELRGQTVFERSRSFLAENTGVDAEAVVREARTREHDAAVQSDVDAARAAGVEGTPSFFLFRDGEFVTRLVGAKSFDVFRSALQV